ncbi:MAG: major facilitator superfamily 1, partial [Solirubrobacterales bacterium]|nr:major facilitator superfamily 1 [Solirubrobacterales bacterium]
GASSAYLTVSEVFPMETRALAIALFFAVGTGIGGITGPLLFGNFIHSGNVHLIALGFFIGAAAMALGGLAELRYGVSAEQKSLEAIATPLTAVTKRIGERKAARDERARAGRRRYRPGTGEAFYSPGMIGTAGATSAHARSADESLDDEIEEIARTLQEGGPMSAQELARAIDARGWGPQRFRRALGEAVREGRVKPQPNRTYAPA